MKLQESQRQMVLSAPHWHMFLFLPSLFKSDLYAIPYLKIVICRHYNEYDWYVCNIIYGSMYVMTGMLS